MDVVSGNGWSPSPECVSLWSSAHHVRKRVFDTKWKESLLQIGFTASPSPSYLYDVNAETTVCSDLSVGYKDVWKAANNFFQSNLESKCEGSRRPSAHRLFTFFRSPWERFVSAYREVATRIRDTHCKVSTGRLVAPLGRLTCSDFRDDDNPESRLRVAEAILTALFQGQRYSYFFAHFSLMSAYAFSGGQIPSFVGRLECASSDYDAFCRRGPCPAALDSYDKLSLLAYGGHKESSLDVYGYGKGFFDLVKKDGRWRKAIERFFVSVDKACVDVDAGCRRYPPPSPSPPPPPVKTRGSAFRTSFLVVPSPPRTPPPPLHHPRPHVRQGLPPHLPARPPTSSPRMPPPHSPSFLALVPSSPFAPSSSSHSRPRPDPHHLRPSRVFVSPFPSLLPPSGPSVVHVLSVAPPSLSPSRPPRYPMSLTSVASSRSSPVFSVSPRLTGMEPPSPPTEREEGETRPYYSGYVTVAALLVGIWTIVFCAWASIRCSSATRPERTGASSPDFEEAQSFLGMYVAHSAVT